MASRAFPGYPGYQACSSGIHVTRAGIAFQVFHLKGLVVSIWRGGLQFLVVILRFDVNRVFWGLRYGQED